jgi:hypothetical protein
LRNEFESFRKKKGRLRVALRFRTATKIDAFCKPTAFPQPLDFGPLFQGVPGRRFEVAASKRHRAFAMRARLRDAIICQIAVIGGFDVDFE